MAGGNPNSIRYTAEDMPLVAGVCATCVGVYRNLGMLVGPHFDRIVVNGEVYKELKGLPLGETKLSVMIDGEEKVFTIWHDRVAPKFSINGVVVLLGRKLQDVRAEIHTSE